jgi:hypothetical protein
VYKRAEEMIADGFRKPIGPGKKHTVFKLIQGLG